MKKKIVFFTGAGISQESGIQTFRDAGGLWEGYDIQEVASIDGWNRNPVLVLDFYNKRRRQLLMAHPNKAHLLINDFENFFEVQVITQNVDDLHERSGSKNVLHLHGELLKSRNINHAHPIYQCRGDILLGDTDEYGYQLRPHIVWFGEEVPAMEAAIDLVKDVDIFVVIGTSLQVYPAANLLAYVPSSAALFYIDPNPGLSWSNLYFKRKEQIRTTASDGMKILYESLCKV